MGHKHSAGLQLTFFAQKKGIETEVINSQIQPALSRDTSFPVAAGVVID